jgi:hypothetical protein
MDSVQYAETFVKSKQNTDKGSFEESSVFYEQYIRFQFLLTYLISVNASENRF